MMMNFKEEYSSKLMLLSNQAPHDPIHN